MDKMETPKKRPSKPPKFAIKSVNPYNSERHLKMKSSSLKKIVTTERKALKKRTWGNGESGKF